MKIEFQIHQRLGGQAKSFWHAEFGNKWATFLKTKKLFEELFITIWEQLKVEDGDTLVFTIEKKMKEDEIH